MLVRKNSFKYIYVMAKMYSFIIVPVFGRFVCVRHVYYFFREVINSLVIHNVIIFNICITAFFI